MSLILSIETSTRACSVALHKEDQLLSSADLYQMQSHSVMLTTMIENVLKMAGVEKEALDAIALAKGPGSFTGLRIGVSTAKALGFALQIPLIGIDSLKAMAYDLSQTNTGDFLFCPMIDARRMEVYCALFDNKLNTIEETQAKIIDENSFGDYLKSHKTIFFGDGAAKCKNQLGKSENAFFVDDFQPKARSIGQLAFERFKNQEFEDLAYFEPYYLKDFVNNTKVKL